MANKKLKIFDSNEVARINPMDIIRAYKELNLNILREDYFKEVGSKKYACGIGAFYAIKVIKSTNITLDQFWMSYRDAPISDELVIAYKYSNNYIAGYVRGFDGFDIPDMVDQEYKLGFEDGRDCYKKAIRKGA